MCNNNDVKSKVDYLRLTPAYRLIHYDDTIEDE
jgi:hypothetical protein